MSTGWGLIGIGAIADLSIAPAVSGYPDSHLAAACSRSDKRAHAFAAKHGAAAAYADYAEMLADPQVQIVYIASPNALHTEHTVAAVEAGKHVLVEKPMALDRADARRMVDAAARNAVMLGVGFHLRHKETARAGRQAISEGRLGEVFYAEMAIAAGKALYPYDTWRSEPSLAGGGSLLHQGVHAVDLAAFLCGEPIVEVTCMTDLSVEEDVFVGTCRLAGGALVNMVSHSKRPGTRPDWTVFGEAGWLDARGGTTPAPGDTLDLHDGAGTTRLASSPESAYVSEVAAFTDAVRGATELSGDGADGLHAVCVAEALYRSATDKRVVTVEG
ncbi:Gfo/Idh/MocA family oxidoreductase [Mycobacterium sp. 236(2023)]|uniref:Gfo/Idh/MocA family protein n=1 Tax=Mycobacterium sp. 236(2023) TaxID=3038163 RepID=UPI002415919F|nr:Gfo/Idh/MocA family oxidoreductase [Mycobacterium sp. 236(2023)]MDG4663765.1 Gfo/Idh/MocA family oxidoreductase [Mycobacterium sp. 236(2023)]